MFTFDNLTSIGSLFKERDLKYMGHLLTIVDSFLTFYFTEYRWVPCKVCMYLSRFACSYSPGGGGGGSLTIRLATHPRSKKASKGVCF